MAITLLACLPARLLADEQNNTRLVIEAFRCQGNETTSCRFILGYVYLAAGDPVNEDEIQNATLRLSQLRNFEHVAIHLEKGSQRGKVILVVEVKEARSVALQSALGFMTVAGGDSGVIAGRLTDVNLFGKGKILDLFAQSQIPLAGLTQKSTSARLQYIDPQFLGATRYFFGAGLSYFDSHQSVDNGFRFDARVFEASASLGHRFGAFSYVSAGYDHRFTSDTICSYRPGEGSQQHDRTRGSLLVAYGWSSDDPYFPTHGSELRVAVGKSASSCQTVSLFFLKTWPVAENAYLSFGIEQQGTHVTYAHDFNGSLGSLSVRRARWYVEPGSWYYGYTTTGQRDWQAGMRVGVRLDMPELGIVDLFAFGITDWHRGGHP